VQLHSRGFPRLINTICENALITAYARQMQSVTPEIIGDVADEFRLEVLHSPEVKTTAGHNGMGIQRTINVVPDLYSALHGVVGSESDFGGRRPFK
jgi:general secretion pathway protein A